MTLTPDITVMVIGPGRKVEVQYVKRDYREFNRLVGGPSGPGSISMLRIPYVLRERGLAAYCDDDAISRGQEPNGFATHFGHWRLLGPVVFFKDNGQGDEASLNPIEVRQLASYLAKAPPLEVAVEADRDRQFWAAHPSGMAWRSYDTLEELLEDAGI